MRNCYLVVTFLSFRREADTFRCCQINAKECGYGTGYSGRLCQPWETRAPAPTSHLMLAGISCSLSLNKHSGLSYAN